MGVFLVGLLGTLGVLVAIGAVLGLTMLPALVVAFLSSRVPAIPVEESERIEIEEGGPITNGKIDPAYFH